MTLLFEGIVHPSDAIIDSVSALAPCNPFNSRAYAAAQQQVGQVPVALVLAAGSSLVAACIGYMGGRPVARTLEIPSAPDLPSDSPAAAQSYWHDLMNFCRSHDVVQLELGSFSTQRLELPQLREQISRRTRREYVLDLQGPLPKPSSNHRRNISRAQKLGIDVRRTRDSDALGDHTALMSSSMERREQRGETVPTVHADPFDSALLACNAAELFQAHDGRSGYHPSSFYVHRAAHTTTPPGHRRTGCSWARHNFSSRPSHPFCKKRGCTCSTLAERATKRRGCSGSSPALGRERSRLRQHRSSSGAVASGSRAALHPER